jgi:RNA polymerase sigma factor (sigma-70 family)
VGSNKVEGERRLYKVNEMATRQLGKVIQHLRSAVLLRDGAGLTDGQLLEDYLGRRDEAALATLVRRHGPMVWGVCRRVLRNYHDAEDAFQATFLVLVRKAASIASPELLANWLYGVAHQTALKARATTAKRRARERQVTEMPEPAVGEHDLWHDLQHLLDQELSRLPDKYRVAIVLCDLEGKTRKEAARQLGVPEGTLAARLARGRVMLAKRLARHGLAMCGGSLAAVLAQNVASAGLPSSLVCSTIKAATLFAAGQAAAAGFISAKVAALTEGVSMTMFMSKIKAVMVVLVIAAIAGGAGLIYQAQAAESPKAQRAIEPKIDNSNQLAAGTGDDKKAEQPTKTAKVDERQTQTKKVEKMPGVVHGVLDQVDAQKNVITVTLPGVMGIKDGVTVKGESIRLENLPVGKSTKITVDGKEAKLAEVNPKMIVTVELEVAFGRIGIKRLEAKDAK